MNYTKTNSNGSKNPFNSTNHDGTTREVSFHWHKTWQLSKLIYRSNTGCQRAVHPSEMQGKTQWLSLVFSSYGLQLTCPYLAILIWAWEQSFFLLSRWSVHSLEITSICKRPTKKTLKLNRDAQLTAGILHKSVTSFVCVSVKGVRCWYTERISKNAASTFCLKATHFQQAPCQG